MVETFVPCCVHQVSVSFFSPENYHHCSHSIITPHSHDTMNVASYILFILILNYSIKENNFIRDVVFLLIPQLLKLELSEGFTDQKTPIFIQFSKFILPFHPIILY